jgi:hypothetical protein
MLFFEKLFKELSQDRVVSRPRIWFAFAVALITDGLQFSLGPFGWILVDQGLDVLAMVLISWAIGFHMLLLPTFVIEFIPGPDMLPTWTACTAAVIMLRKKANPPPVIDIPTEVTSVSPAASRDGVRPVPPRISPPQQQIGNP